MRPTRPWLRCFSLLLALSLAACAAYQAQHGSATGRSSAAAVEAAAPGREFTELPEERQVSQVRGEADEAKKSLAAHGKYACCVRPACNECLLKRGECHCREVARKGGPCCGECTEDYVRGRGAVEGVSAWELLERRKHMLDDWGKSPGNP